MTPPQFVNTDYNAILARLIGRYETIVGRTLFPAQVERLILNACAYEFKIALEQMQAAATQTLLPFATAPALDYLAELIGVTRLAAAGAVTSLQFSAVEGHPGVVIPAGTRVASGDGRIIFVTSAEATIAPGDTSVTVGSVATTTGAAANGYVEGEINKLLDPRPYVTGVLNVTATGGGANVETDDELRERVRSAPGQFSVAGPADAYKFHARRASASIIDVSVVSPGGGQVNVYPLIAGGQITPQTTLDLVADTLNDIRVRPLTDTVFVLSPEVIEYEVNIELTTYTEADTATIENEALQRIGTYLLEREENIGLDVKRAQLIALAGASVDKVFDVNVVLPAEDVVVEDHQVATPTAVTITVIATSNG